MRFFVTTSLSLLLHLLGSNALPSGFTSSLENEGQNNDRMGNQVIVDQPSEGFLKLVQLSLTMSPWGTTNEAGMIEFHRKLLNGDFRAFEHLSSSLSHVDELGRTALHFAALSGNVEIFRALLPHLSENDLRATDNFGRSALHYAAIIRNNGEIIKELLRLHGDVNLRDVNLRTPFHFAVISGTASNVDAMLTSQELDRNAKDNKGLTPLDYAIRMQSIRSTQQMQ